MYPYRDTFNLRFTRRISQNILRKVRVLIAIGTSTCLQFNLVTFRAFTLAAETRYVVACIREVLIFTCAKLAFVVLNNTPEWLLHAKNTASHVYFLNLTKRHMLVEFAAQVLLTEVLKFGEWMKEQCEIWRLWLWEKSSVSCTTFFRFCCYSYPYGIHSFFLNLCNREGGGQLDYTADLRPGK